VSELDILPAAARHAWQQIASIVPPEAYLMGGTAIAVRLRHRESEDLDFFLEAPLDLSRLEQLAGALGQLAPTVVQTLAAGTLNCLFGATRVQFLDTSTQHLIAPPDTIAGIRVGGLADLLAAKLVAITGRAALRDYVDLWALETLGGLRVEEGLALVEVRYPRARQEQTWRTILLALGSIEEVRGKQMPRMRGQRVTARQIERYWVRRAPEIVRNLDDTGMA
jgi:predicted nucleotidyltransferase component of viral defense system